MGSDLTSGVILCTGTDAPQAWWNGLYVLHNFLTVQSQERISYVEHKRI